MRLSRVLSVTLTVAAIVGLTALRAMAGTEGDPVAVPEPGTLTMLSSAVGAGILGLRWFRRR